MLLKAKEKIEKELEMTNPYLEITSFNFETVARVWLDDCQERLKPSTFLGRKRVVERFIKNFGKQKMIDFTMFQVQNYFNNLKLKKSTISNYFQLFRWIFDFAERMEIIKDNVIKKVRVIYPKKTLEDFKKTERKYVTWAELSLVFSKIKKVQSLKHTV